MMKPDHVFYERSVHAYMERALGEASHSANTETLRKHQANGGIYTGSEWVGGLTGELKSVCTTLLGGWPEGVKAIEKAGEGFKLPPIPSIRRRVKFGAQGDELDIHTVRNGRIDRAWRSSPRQQAQSPGQVHLVINNDAPGMWDADKLKWRGAAGLALAKALTTAGYSVRIDVVTAACDGMTCLFTVKDYAQPLNVASVAGVIAHPAGYRRVTFAYWVAQAKYGRVPSGLGPIERITIGDLLARYPHQFNSRHSNIMIPNNLCSSPEAQAFIKVQIPKIIGGEAYDAGFGWRDGELRNGKQVLATRRR